jgi:2-polyprenyl-3-methyl-5-hydroxy-6-metoxy-1,4-benzoquinol methylase
MTFDPKRYWEERIQKLCNLEGVGCEGRSEIWNNFLYKSKVRAINRALNNLHLDITGYKVLDIGCGVGFWIDYFLGKNAISITGIDITSSAIEFCKSKYSDLTSVKLICGDIGDKNFHQKNINGIDIVTAFDVLYHITDDENFFTAINNIAQTLKSGGYLILTDILSKSEEKISQQQHVRWRSYWKYKEVLKQNGLEIIYLAPVYCLLHSPVDTRGLIGKFFKALYYGITVKFTSKSNSIPGSKVLTSLLYAADSFLTLFPKFGISTKLLIAQKKINHA